VASVASARVDLLAGRTSFAEVAADLELRLRTDLLVPLSRWVTPPAYPRRFDARFFAAVAPAGEASIGGAEVAAIDWHVPSDALDAMADGRIGMWLPTSCTLQQLEHLGDLADLDRLRPGSLDPVAVDEPARDVVRVRMPAGGGVAGQPVNAYLVGRRRFVLVDPGDPTGPALERCLEEAAARSGSIAAIALTHADPDHHGGAEALAEQLSIPILAGRGAARRFPYEISEVADGAVVDAGDVPLTVLETPGPRPEHLAFLAGDAAVITGDLDGRRGSRSIVGATDERAWAASRARVRELAGARALLAGHPPE
jgi:glyoxylase-like metal-dependent hydrolase (beta-lactamase superfamily II)